MKNFAPVIVAVVALVGGVINNKFSNKPRWATTTLNIFLGVVFLVSVAVSINSCRIEEQLERERAMAKAKEAQVGILKSPIDDLLVSGEKLPDIEIGNGGTIFHSMHPEGGSLLSFLSDEPGLPNLPPELSKVAEENYLIAAMDSGKLKVSAKLVGRDGSIIVKIINNEWETNVKPVSWDRSYSSDALEVLDGAGDVVLQLRMLPDRVQCQGKFSASTGAWVCISSGEHVGLISFSTPQNPNRRKCDIKPIFKYPSNLHFGELQQ